MEAFCPERFVSECSDALAELQRASMPGPKRIAAVAAPEACNTLDHLKWQRHQEKTSLIS
jgi:hypothetical protein